MKKLFTILLIFVVLCSCSGYKVLTSENEGPYSKVYRMSGNFTPVDRKIVGPYGNFEINIETKVTSGDSAVSYCLIVACMVQNGFFIKEGQSLTLDIDGQQAQLTRNHAPYKQNEVIMQWHKYVVEAAWFDVDSATLKRLQNATTAEFVVTGSKGSLVGSFTKKNLENFKSYCSQHVE